jgi:epoxide hydrolase-like predicted phosphatase
VIRAILWDFGGVLMRTHDFTPREELARHFQMSRNELENLVYVDEWGQKAQLGQISLDRRWELLAQKLNITIGEIPPFLEKFWGGDVLDLDLVDYVRGLRSRYKTGLLSNAFSDLRRMITDVLKIADIFDVMVISAEVGFVKPDRRIYHLALERLRVAPEEAVFIDDFLHNVQGAQAIGMQAIHFQNSIQVRQALDILLEADQS